jgi:hypothetical protein
MIGLMVHYPEAAIDLLQKDYSHHLMREGHPGKGEH